MDLCESIYRAANALSQYLVCINSLALQTRFRIISAGCHLHDSSIEAYLVEALLSHVSCTAVLSRVTRGFMKLSTSHADRSQHAKQWDGSMALQVFPV